MAEHHDATMQLFSTIFRFRKLSVPTALCETLSPGEMSMMIVLNAYHGKLKKEVLPVCELNSRLHTTQPAATQLVNRLEAKGLVSRKSDEADRRTVLVSVTPQGYKLFKKEYEATLNAVDEIIERMGADRAETLLELLDEFADVTADVLAEHKVK